MNELIKKIKKDTGNSDDIIYKELKIHNQTVNIISNEVLTDTKVINDYILRAIVRVLEKNISINDLQSFLPDNNIKIMTNYKEMLNLLYQGFALVLFNKKVLAIEVRSGLNRGVGEASNEPSIKGPKDAFLEHFNTNLGLIRRRIKSNHLWMKTLFIGKELFSATIYVAAFVKSNVILS